jgi:hypothetical protein
MMRDQIKEFTRVYYLLGDIDAHRDYYLKSNNEDVVYAVQNLGERCLHSYLNLMFTNEEVYSESARGYRLSLYKAHLCTVFPDDDVINNKE